MAAKTLYTVIVADDEDELREAVCTMIPWEEYGFRLVGSAGNGLDALQLVEKHEPDLLLTDIRMPFISGIELARQVREVRPATNIACRRDFHLRHRRKQRRPGQSSDGLGLYRHRRHRGSYLC